jgi:hypothetical protein
VEVVVAGPARRTVAAAHAYTIGAGAAIFVLAVCFRFLTLVSFSNDEFVALASAQQLLFGEWPTRDFFDPGMPLAYVVSAVFQLMFGRSLFAEGILTAVALAAAAVLTVVAAKRLSGSLTIGVVTALLEILIFPRGYSYPKMLLYAAAPLLLWWYQERAGSAGRLLALAVFVQIAFLFRHDHGLFIGASFACAVALGDGSLSTPRDVGRRLGRFVAFAAVATLPYLIYIAMSGGVVRYFAQGVAFSAAEAAGNHLTIPPFGPAIDWERNGEAFLFFLFYLLPCVSAVVLWRTRGQDDARPTFAAVAPVIVLCLLADRAFLRDELWTRLADAFVPASLLFTWLVGGISRLRSNGRRVAWRAVASIVAFAALLAVVALGRTMEQLDRAGLFGGLRRMPERFTERSEQLHERFNEHQMPSRAALALVPFFEYVDRCTASDHRLLLPGFIPEAAVYARRPFAGGRSTILAGFIDTPDDRRRIQERLMTQTVPFVIVAPNDKATVWAAYPELARFVQDGYKPLVTYRSEGGDPIVEVFVSRTLPPRTQDPTTGWSCFR